MIRIEKARSMDVDSLKEAVKDEYHRLLYYEQMMYALGKPPATREDYRELLAHWNRLTGVLHDKMGDAEAYQEYMDQVMDDGMDEVVVEY